MALWAHRSRFLFVGSAAMLAAFALIVTSLVAPAAAEGRLPAHHRPDGARSSAARDRSPTAGLAMTPPAMSGSEPPYEVQTSSVRFFDPTRMTAARGTVPATQGRVLLTDLYVPVGASGPRPLVVFAHGWNSNPGIYAALLEGWAAAGFVVAAPVFPDSTDLYPGTPVSDYSDQALDISFVITSLLRDRAVPIDPTRIAVTGHSDGGTDVAVMALDPAYADPRVRAYVCMSGEMPSGVAPYTVGPTKAAALFAVGSEDEYGLYPLTTQVFQAAQAAAKAMLIEPGGSHLGSFIDATPAAATMREAETQFLELALEPRTPSSSAIATALAQPAVGSLQVVPAS